MNMGKHILKGLLRALRLAGVVTADQQEAPQSEPAPDAPRNRVELLRKAAEQGDASAMFKLGVAYIDGRGVPKDEREAVNWSRKAAEQGHAKAMFNLGSMYVNGRGVQKDEREAVNWYRKAAEQGYASAMLNLDCKEVRQNNIDRGTSLQSRFD